MHKYIHDAMARVVYEIPHEPTVIDQKDNRGRRVSWSVSMEIRITRADNKLNGNRWEHATSAYPTQSFDAHYTKEEVISYFLMHHEPTGESISREQYMELQAQYEAIARERSGE
jgi:hypothetical protein